MSDFQQFLQYKALAFKFSLENNELTDAVIEAGQVPLPLRNVCAKLSVELADRLDQTCSNLDVSKRQFIERALIEAMDQADAALTSCGVWDDVEKRLEQK
nr:hypothetical protein pA6H1_p02 [Pseudomonas sp.]